MQTLKGHTEEVLALAVWPDGNFASGSRDGTIKLWSNEGACERTLQAQAIVSSLAILHDGRLASGCGNIKLWSRNGEYLQILEEKADVLVVMSDGRLATADEKIIKILENELVPRPISALEIVSPPVKAGTMKPDDDDVQQLEENTKADTPAGMKVSTVSVSHPEQKDVAVPMPEPVINLRSEYEGLKHVRDIEQKKDEMGITPFLKSLQQQITKQGEEIRELHEVLAQKEREFQEIRERLVRAERLLFPQTASGSTFGSSTLFQSPPASASLVAREQPLAGAIVLTADQMATSTSKSQERVDPVENAHETRTAFS